jgi:hypothetical protein
VSTRFLLWLREGADESVLVLGMDTKKEEERKKKDKKKKKAEEKKAREKADDPKAGADVGKIVNLMAGDANRVRSVFWLLYF